MTSTLTTTRPRLRAAKKGELRFGSSESSADDGATTRGDSSMGASAGVATAMVELAVFPTELGWMAVAARGRCALRLVIGGESPQSVTQSISAALTPSDCFENARLPVQSLRAAWFNEGRKACPWLRELVERLQAYAAGKPALFDDVAVDAGPCTPFQRRVLEQCRRVAPGETVSYGALAARAGAPGAARAVGNVMANNRCPIVIPCHRVVQSGGRLGGFSAPQGVALKRLLLDLEWRWPDAARRR